MRKSGKNCLSRAGFLVYHEEREVREGFGFFLIFYFPLFVKKLFFFAFLAPFVVMLLHRKPKELNCRLDMEPIGKKMTRAKHA